MSDSSDDQDVPLVGFLDVLQVVPSIYWRTPFILVGPLSLVPFLTRAGFMGVAAVVALLALPAAFGLLTQGLLRFRRSPARLSGLRQVAALFGAAWFACLIGLALRCQPSWGGALGLLGVTPLVSWLISLTYPTSKQLVLGDPLTDDESEPIEAGDLIADDDLLRRLIKLYTRAEHANTPPFERLACQRKIETLIRQHHLSREATLASLRSSLT